MNAASLDHARPTGSPHPSLAQLRPKDLDMNYGTCCSTRGWCTQANALLHLPGFYILDGAHRLERPGQVLVSIETDADIVTLLYTRAGGSTVTP